MPRPAKPGSVLVATPEQVMMAVANGTVQELLTTRKATFSVLEKAVHLMKAFNPKVKIPDEITEKMAELESTGRVGGVGKSPAMIGDTREYSIQNWNEKKKEARAPIVVLPLSMYQAAAKPGARVSVSFGKENISIKVIPA